MAGNVKYSQRAGKRAGADSGAGYVQIDRNTVNDVGKNGLAALGLYTFLHSKAETSYTASDENLARDLKANKNTIRKWRRVLTSMGLVKIEKLAEGEKYKDKKGKTRYKDCYAYYVERVPIDSNKTDSHIVNDDFTNDIERAMMANNTPVVVVAEKLVANNENNQESLQTNLLKSIAKHNNENKSVLKQDENIDWLALAEQSANNYSLTGKPKEKFINQLNILAGRIKKKPNERQIDLVANYISGNSNYDVSKDIDRLRDVV